MNDDSVGASAAIDIVTIRVGEHLFGIEARQVSGSLPARDDSGDALDASELFRLPSAKQGTQRHVLTIRSQPEDWRLLVNTPPELRSLPAEAIYPLPQFVAARTSLRGLRALALIGKEPVLLVDINAMRTI